MISTILPDVFYTYTSHENKKKGQLETIQLTFLNICYN